MLESAPVPEAGPGGDPAAGRSPPPEPRRSSRRFGLFLACLAGLLLILLAGRFVFDPYRIASPSMKPTLLGGPDGGGDIILVNRMAYVLSSPARWEVVVFRAVDEPPDRASAVVKRVVGLPGETVEVLDGEVLIDGAVVERPEHLREVHYLRTGAFGMGPVKLGPEDYFVLGDNSYPSLDSRRFGPVPRRNLVGRASCIVAPLKRAGSIR